MATTTLRQEPVMPTAQDARLRALMDVHEAVSGFPLGNGHLSLIAREGDAVKVAEVLDPQGQALAPGEAIRVLGQVRDLAKRTEEHVTDAVTASVAVRLQAGEDVNLAEAARDGGIGRATLYRRLEEMGVEATS